MTTTDPHVLRDYAFLADGERGAVIGPRGEVAWLCFPGWDGAPVFASLVGGSGAYIVRPTGRFVWGGQYEPGSLIWRNRWVVGTVVVECREALAFPGRVDHAILARRIVAAGGEAEVEIHLDAGARLRQAAAGRPWEGRRKEVRIRWTGPEGMTPRDSVLHGTVRVGRGAPLDLVLELSTGPLPDQPAEADEVWDATEEAWRRRIPRFDSSAAPRDARHAYAVLRGMTSASGAMVAAATTSLPERANEGRNYDYRYAWVRDQCYAGVAAACAGGDADDLVDDAVRFVHERLLADGPGLRPAYRTGGGVVPPETELDLPGYPGAPVVVSGNRAGEQLQLDIFGEALALFAAASHRDRMHADAWRAAEIAVDAIEQRRQEPDAGVWELAPREFAHSRLACIAGLRQIAAARSAGPGVARWLALADAMAADAAAQFVHPSGRWQRAADDPGLDASLLLGGIRGAFPADDPRTLATLDAVRRELVRDGYVFRYHVHHEPLGQAEGAFLLCGFWLALACRQAGDHTQAARFFERNRSACGPAGLFSEEFDVHQRQLRGNFPQAFVHALLLETDLVLGEELSAL